MNAANDAPMILPCGCRVETIEGCMVMTACKAGESCKWVRYVVAEIQRQGKPHSVLDLGQ